MSTSDVELGQWYVDFDRRCRKDGKYRRVGQVVSVHTRGDEPTAEIRWDPDDKGNVRTTRVKFRRMTASSTGYKWIGDGPERPAIPPAPRGKVSNGEPIESARPPGATMRPIV